MDPYRFRRNLIHDPQFIAGERRPEHLKRTGRDPDLSTTTSTYFVKREREREEIVRHNIDDDHHHNQHGNNCIRLILFIRKRSSRFTDRRPGAWLGELTENITLELYTRPARLFSAIWELRVGPERVVLWLSLMRMWFLGSARENEYTLLSIFSIIIFQLHYVNLY